MKNKLTLVLLVLFSLSAGTSLFSAEGDIAVINVSEDAFVQAGGTANTNYGSEERLIVKRDNNAGTRRLSYLKFIIPNHITADEIGYAGLSLYIIGANTGVPNIKWIVYSVNNDSWSENTITFNNKPTYSELNDEIIQVPTVTAANANVRINLTNAVKEAIAENGILSICIDGSAHDSKGDVVFYSKENQTDDEYIPRLILSSEAEPEEPKPEPLDLTVAETVLSRIRADKFTYTRDELETDVAAFLGTYNETTGAFSDVDYADQSRSDWKPLEHLYRLKEMSFAYTEPGNNYFEDESLYDKIVKGLEYWYLRWPSSSNWWFNRIGHPRELGLTLVALYPGKEKITETAFFEKLTSKWRSSLGRPDTPNDATTAGANKCDIAMHWLYRSCLTRNKEDLEFAVEQAFLIVTQTTGEGIQHDWSFRQHGAQLYIGGYGTELMQLVVRQASYLAGTPYALSGEKLNVISQFVRNTYLNVIRGQRMNYNVLGRGITRTDNTARLSDRTVFNLLKEIDSDNASEYENAIRRINKEADASYGLTPSQVHYYRGEYTLHQRPEYTFDVRMASSRMARSEYDIYENKSGFFLSDGGTCITVDGEEYGPIIPLWDWKKIPGTTVPDLETMVRADSYIFNGRSNYAGGVTDGLYGVTAFHMINNQALYEYNDDIGYAGTPNPQKARLAALDFEAKKSWFLFEREIVCLGAGIRSGHDVNLFTTVNQCRKVGNVIVSANGSSSTQGPGTKNYTDVDWVLNDKVAYFFPKKGNITVSNESRTGSWKDVNNSGSETPITQDVFSLWFDHGVKPVNETYAYIIVPDMSEDEARTYTASSIEILANTGSLQAVYHKELNLYGFAFFRAGVFHNDKLTVRADDGCVVLIKDADKDELIVHVADPQKKNGPVTLGIGTPSLNGIKKIEYTVSESQHLGKSMEFTINRDSPFFQEMYNRTDWTIVTSLEGASDSEVGGTNPGYIIDEDITGSSFLFVKPGRSYGGIIAPADYIPSFTIDMKKVYDIDCFVYRHRTANNTNALLRAERLSFYGKNNESDEFELILADVVIPTDSRTSEVEIELPDTERYRYVKVEITRWDTSGGSTVQVSDFRIGRRASVDPTGLNETNHPASKPLTVFPNPVSRGGIVTVKVPSDAPFTVEVKDMQGRIIELSDTGQINTRSFSPGIYVVSVRTIDGELTAAGKLIVKH
ncbi:MAG: DNRLRE domain-containing protein [Dysgonamonadaceae bacterium]|jgi:chondroitin AC lyase|nr:DNRLRE domain-containing protein [Dysgonamonadaceae bacterium]